MEGRLVMHRELSHRTASLSRLIHYSLDAYLSLFVRERAADHLEGEGVGGGEH